MKELEKIKDGIAKINYILTKEQKKYCILVLFLSIIYALFELAGVSIIVPLIQAFLSPETLRGQKYLVPFIELFGLKTTTQIIIFVCIVIILVYFIKNAYGIFYTWISNKLSNKIKRELSVRILSSYLKQGYHFFVNNSTARLVRGMDADVSRVYTIILQIFGVFSKALAILGIIIFTVMKAPVMAVFLCCLVIFCFLLTQSLFRKFLQKNGNLARQYSAKCIQTTYEALQGSKEVLVTNRQNFFVNHYAECIDGYNRAELKRAMGQNSPVNIIEAVCIAGLMCAVIVEVIFVEDVNYLLMQMATVAIAAFRVLPYLGAILSSFNVIVFNAPALSASYDTLFMVKDLEKREAEIRKDKDAEEKEYRFHTKLELSHLTFAYDKEREKVIDDLTMEIQKGTSIAFIGASGAGKTTLADIILGLFKPQEGSILMDGIDIEEIGKKWNKIVGYVPQDTHLLDTTIRRNVAFGIEDRKIDEEKVWRAVEMAQLKPFIEELPDGLDTKVGEMGVKFSGGQRQRLSIARALYNEPDILVLDEATAALDGETENAVMKAIDALQGYKTLIIVAHRLTTVRNCDKIYEIKEGKAFERNKRDIFADIE